MWVGHTVRRALAVPVLGMLRLPVTPGTRRRSQKKMEKLHESFKIDNLISQMPSHCVNENKASGPMLRSGAETHPGWSWGPRSAALCLQSVALFHRRPCGCPSSWGGRPSCCKGALHGRWALPWWMTSSPREGILGRRAWRALASQLLELLCSGS